MNQYQKFAMQMIEQFDALGDLTLLPNFAIRKMLLGFLVVEGLEIELARNGYEVLKGARLKSLKEAIQALDVPETDFGNISKTPQLGVFNFRAFLNLSMLVSESERAKLLHSMAKVIAKVNTASIANGLGPIQDAQGMNLNID